jgi:hypothetical protein
MAQVLHPPDRKRRKEAGTVSDVAWAYAKCSLFGPWGVGFWIFLLILALLGVAWAHGGAY